MTPHGDKQKVEKCGLVLSGGGARGAYQAGVIKAIGEIAARAEITSPFPIISGISAGALNAGFLAAGADNFSRTCSDLAELWVGINSKKVFRTDLVSIGRIALRLLGQAFLGGFYRSAVVPSLLDTSPLWEFLNQAIDVSKIKKNLSEKFLDALAITATAYSTSGTINFVQAEGRVQLWNRARRISMQDEIKIDHLMASAALPVLFPAIKINNEFYGDGSLRNTAPLSPALHLGADKLLIISVRKQPTSEIHNNLMQPSIGRILGVVLNAILMDATTVDLERLERINQTVNLIPSAERSKSTLRPIIHLAIHPSEDIGKIAKEEAKHLPKTVRFLVRGLGSKAESSDLISYLLFEPSYTQRLVELGYNDGLRSSEKIRSLFAPL